MFISFSHLLYIVLGILVFSFVSIRLPCKLVCTLITMPLGMAIICTHHDS